MAWTISYLLHNCIRPMLIFSVFLSSFRNEIWITSLIFRRELLQPFFSLLLSCKTLNHEFMILKITIFRVLHVDSLRKQEEGTRESAIVVNLFDRCLISSEPLGLSTDNEICINIFSHPFWARGESLNVSIFNNSSR